MKQILFALPLFLLSEASMAQSPTWSTEVAPILYKHCVTCHRVGGVGNFSLETWTDAKNNAGAMLDAVSSRYMPPWRAEPAYRHFKGENYLSDASSFLPPLPSTGRAMKTLSSTVPC